MNIFKFCSTCGGNLKGKEIEEIERLICEKCGFIFYENPKATAGAVIVRGDQVLLVKRAIEPQKGFWDLPGGFLEKDEHPESTLRREIEEELSVKIEILGLLGIYMDRYGYNETDSHTLNIYYLARLAAGEPKAASDIEDIHWFAKGGLPSNIAFENNKDALRSWQKRTKD